MLASPFTFYRGSAILMAADLAGRPTSGLVAQLCGDAHLANFGLFASAERSLVFDINDFDETLPGPWEWDVQRLAASLALAGRDNGFGPRDRERVTLDGVRAYRVRMRELAAMRELDVWYAKSRVEAGIVPGGVDTRTKRLLRHTAERARARDHLHAHERLTELRDGRRRLANDPPLSVPIADLVGATLARRYERRLGALFDIYTASLDPARRRLVERFRCVEMGRRVVGVGSVGLHAWIVLLLGRDEDDPLFLQVKEAQASVLEAHLAPSAYPSHGQRVVVGQRLMQTTGDILLGWLHSDGPDGWEADYYVRQLRDWKGSPPVEDMGPTTLAAYARACGGVLARAHARTGDRIAIASYLGKGPTFDRAMARFAEAYADQAERDHAALVLAVEEGRIGAIRGL